MPGSRRITLATLGVLITSVLTGLAAAHILGIPLLHGILLGGIVGSTDAAAVFAVLRSSGLRLRQRLSATLEIESGSNDPMAIFLTVGLLQVLLGRMEMGPDLVWLFVSQMVLGTVVGLAVGRGAVWLVNWVNLGAAGLYPVLASAAGLLAYGVAASLGGSGFLAVYLAGIVLGNSKIVFQRGIFLFHDAGAWLAQIVMFVVLGLLSFPSRLLEVAGEGLLIALVLMFVARPLAVVLTLLPFRFNWRELTLLSWVGLKGAVPITLATFPLILGLPGAALLFDVVFFVVLVSALLQGWTLPVLARRLKLELPAEPIAPVTLEITSLHNVDGDIVEYAVEADSRAVGHRVRELALPEGVVIALIARGGEVIPPQGKTQILAGDHVFVVLRSDTRPAVDRIFGRDRQLRAEVLPRLEVPLRGSITAGELNEFYGIRLEVPEDVTLDLLLRERLVEDKVAPGMRLILGDVVLSVREVEKDGRIEQVGIAVLERRMADKGADARA